MYILVILLLFHLLSGEIYFLDSYKCDRCRSVIGKRTYWKTSCDIYIYIKQPKIIWIQFSTLLFQSRFYYTNIWLAAELKHYGIVLTDRRATVPCKQKLTCKVKCLKNFLELKFSHILLVLELLNWVNKSITLNNFLCAISI